MAKGGISNAMGIGDDLEEIIIPVPSPPSLPSLPTPGAPPRSTFVNSDIEALDQASTGWRNCRQMIDFLNRGSNSRAEQVREIYRNACYVGGRSYRPVNSNYLLCDCGEGSDWARNLPPPPVAAPIPVVEPIIPPAPPLAPEPPPPTAAPRAPTEADVPFDFGFVAPVGGIQSLYQTAPKALTETAARATTNVVAALARGANVLLGLFWPSELGDSDLYDPYQTQYQRARRGTEFDNSPQRLFDIAVGTTLPLPQPSPVRPVPVVAAQPTLTNPSLLFADPVLSFDGRIERDIPVIRVAEQSGIGTSLSQFYIGDFAPVPAAAPRRSPVVSEPAPQPVRSRLPDLQPDPITSLDPITSPITQPQPEPPGVDSGQDRCVIRRQPRSVCYVTLTKERTDPTRDTVRRWRKIKCQ